MVRSSKLAQLNFLVLNLFRLKTRSLLFFVLVLLTIAQSKAQELSHFTERPPVLDGVLDDEVWQNSATFTGYKTFVPDFSKDMPFKTIAYMAHDAENLYFAFKCYDDPNQVKTSIAARDKIGADDWICINMDSFNDKQTLYGFYVNPNGIQMDTRFAAGQDDPGQDMIWYSKGQIDEDGYSIEVRIPFKSIRYAYKGGKVDMGLIFERRISRFSMQGTFPELDPNQGLNFLTQGMHVQYNDVKKTTLFEAIPAITYSQNRTQEEGKVVNDSNFEPSLTLKYGLTSDLVLDATINPDFSQVEADATQVEVNQRFAVFYPERRPFFLEGNENFNWAGTSFLSSVRSVVNTRTIAAPTVAAKLTGKLSKKNTISTIFALDREYDDDFNEVDEKAKVGILRYKRTFENDSYLGAVGTWRSFNGDYNAVYGADGQYRFLEANLLSANWLRSSTFVENDGGPSQTVDANSWTIDFRHNTRKREIGFTLFSVDDGFQSDVGQVQRTGITRFGMNYSPKFYPKKGLIKRVDQTYYYGGIWDKPSGLYEYSYFFQNAITLPRSTRIQFAANYANEIYEAQKFDRSSARIELSSQLTKRIFLRGNYRIRKNAYYSTPEQGWGHSFNGGINLQASDKFNAELTYIYSDLYSDKNGERFYQVHIPRARITYQMNQYLFFRVITQYNSQSEQLAPNFLASFTYIPGTVVHLGYGSVYERKEWDGNDYIQSDNFLEMNRGLFFKASYLFRYNK